MRYRVTKVNPFFRNTVINILELYEPHLKIKELVYHASDLIEQNPALMTYGDITLYDHQKELFTICKHKHPKLISYIAPTGTGKTMSPIGLSENNRIIFVCAARHVGLALAKAAISSEKKVAFAFGCNSCDDIRLHYFAATDYVRNKRSGMIAKVDNSVGDKVEIMICDLKSYLCAMYYMLAFNKKEDIILYWDEPTISMDYVEHEIHPIIHDNWSKNEIPNIVLSSATLPTCDEISETIQDFTSRFDGAEFYNINSYDCKKTIPIINKEGYVDMPHYIAESYSDMVDIIRHCKENKTLLRYIDLEEAIRLIKLINDNDYVCKERYRIEEYFSNTGDVTMVNIKQYYLELLESLNSKAWERVSSMILETRQRRHKSNILVVTEDAHTLTDGPTIFLADNIDKISNFCIKYANIPKRVEEDIMKVIEYNTLLNNKISSMQRTLEDGTRSDDEKEKKMSEGRVAPAMKQLIEKINEAQRCVKSVELASIFVPNTDEHLERYANKRHKTIVSNIKKGTNSKPFTCDISDDIVEKIMLINDVDSKWKMLLLMGIGVFVSHTSADYTEIMKTLAQRQKLYMIIASSDFIYGTNYQFCHSYISKDLGYMSQEKLVQAMGRVGRANLQSDYTIRFRENELIKKLFHKEYNKPEVVNMRTLFCS